MSRDREELPSGWCTTTLREIAEIVGGVTKDAKKSAGQGFREVPYLRVANVQRGRLDLADVKSIAAAESDIQKLRLLPGDILLNEGGDRDKLGRGWIWQGQLPVCIHQNHVFRARLVTSEIDPVYVAHFTNSVAQAYFADQGAQTTNLASISMTKLGALPIVLPPAKEQRRIVAKLDVLLSELDAGVAELKTAQAKLQRYRQSLLKAAVQGDLTADWRAAHPPAETGAELLQRILAERRARWEAAQRAKAEAAGKPLAKGWQDKCPTFVHAEASDPISLPAGWWWTTLGECFRVAVGATPSRGRPEYWSGDIPWVSSGEVRFSRIRSTRECITPQGLANSSTQVNPKGSVLLGMIGEGRTRGQAAILDVPAANNQNCAAVWVSETPVPSEFVFAWLWSRYEETRRGSSGNNQPALNKSIVEQIPMPLPPLAEMQEIARQLELHLGSIEDLDRAVSFALAQAEAQRQNILRAAFAGRLVPQDPNDEPADALLARIRAQRAAVVPAARLRKAGGRPARSVA